MQPTAPVSDMNNVVCPNCGASLNYAPGTTNLACQYCGSSFEIHDEVPQQDAQKENDLMLALSNSWKESQAQGSAYVVKCPACGAETALGTNIFSGQCTFCGSPITVPPDAKAIANPQGVLP